VLRECLHQRRHDDDLRFGNDVITRAGFWGAAPALSPHVGHVMKVSQHCPAPNRQAAYNPMTHPAAFKYDPTLTPAMRTLQNAVDYPEMLHDMGRCLFHSERGIEDLQGARMWESFTSTQREVWYARALQMLQESADRERKTSRSPAEDPTLQSERAKSAPILRILR
jgi:hypothetical protein